jgi:hypothetical protein
MTAATRGYAFDNDSDQAQAHHAALADLLDPITRNRITGLLDLTGARCLEVAAGRGSIAGWLAGRVGETGSVLATDLKPQRIPPHPRLRVREHDITMGHPIGHDHDLIHARLLLNHLTQRRHVLHRLAVLLAPGGVVLTEDFWPVPAPDFVVCAGSRRDEDLLRDYHRAHQLVLTQHGNDRTWSRNAPAAYLAEGLTDVHATVHGGTWRGGEPGCRLLVAGLGQLRGELAAAGAQDLDRVAELLADPGVLLHGHLLYSTAGRRPA